ncbi:MAG: hypothetical protein ACTHNA_14125 [Sphingopyxis terrae]|uniref:hypothetical protein n=1 Tax=Sphingopyxis terrae TaxID=33052 RepID=UPI003F801DDA
MAMQRIPLDSGETMTFVPAALSDVEAPPSFVLKAPTRRDRERMEYALLEEGLRHHSEEDMRDTTIDELCRLWDVSKEDPQVQRVLGYWKALDDYIEEVKALAIEAEAARDAGEDGPPELAPFAHPDRDVVNQLLQDLAESSDILRRMSVDEIRWNKEFPRFAIAHCVKRWTGLSKNPRLHAGIVEIDSVCDMQDEMVEKFGDAGRTALNELAATVMRRFYLDRSAEKNSKSPAPSAPTPQATKEAGSDADHGKSPASASSSETPGE